MKTTFYDKLRFFLILALIGLFSNACKTDVQNEALVYNNDFESNNLTNISDGVITLYNNSNVLGQYNNSGFVLKVNDLPKHSLLKITFDLYIHDNWRGQLPPDGPDIWQMFIDNAPYINTTFSNLECKQGNICPPQSYPADYPNNNNNPRKGSFRTDLPGVCGQLGVLDGTTQYEISKTFTHTNATVVIRCLDKLNQANNNDPKCDKSWSVDNVIIKAITL